MSASRNKKQKKGTEAELESIQSEVSSLKKDFEQTVKNILGELAKDIDLSNYSNDNSTETDEAKSQISALLEEVKKETSNLKDFRNKTTEGIVQNHREKVKQLLS